MPIPDPINFKIEVLDERGLFVHFWQVWLSRLRDWLLENIIGGQLGTIVNATSTRLFDIALPPGTFAGGVVRGVAMVTDGTDSQALQFGYGFAAVNKAGVYITTIQNIQAASPKALSAGTLVINPAPDFVTGTNKVTFRLGVDSSLAATSIAVNYEVKSYGRTQISPVGQS